VPMMVKKIPMNQTRNVPTGIVGSSVLETTARTSGYGESSINAASILISSMSASEPAEDRSLVSRARRARSRRAWG
jgi:hypothetical protein